ncbi:MAG TPA: hypothetical protein VMT52_19780, partial [Planctomycetota bacterium]|nr:hypothetical protein [Planctomycetota bacterium]
MDSTREILQITADVLAQAQPGARDLLGILPALVLFGTGALVLLLDIFWLQAPPDDVPAEPGRPTEKSALHFLSALGAVIAGAIVCARLGSAGAESQGYFYDAVREDRFSSAMSLLIILGTVISLLGAGDALRRRGLEHGEFHCLVLFAAGSMVLFTQSVSL